MAAQLFILGIAHKFQCGGRDCTAEQAEQFATELRSACKTYGVRRIAEEMTAYGRKQYQVGETVAYKVAQEMTIYHHDVDLSPAARQALAVTDDTVWRASQTLRVEDAGAKLSNALDALRNELRERVWVARILKGSPWPVLAVIGADHVQPFRKLWRKFGIKVEILHEDWEPKNGRHAFSSEVQLGIRIVRKIHFSPDFVVESEVMVA